MVLACVADRGGLHQRRSGARSSSSRAASAAPAAGPPLPAPAPRRLARAAPPARQQDRERARSAPTRDADGDDRTPGRRSRSPWRAREDGAPVLGRPAASLICCFVRPCAMRRGSRALLVGRGDSAMFSGTLQVSHITSSSTSVETSARRRGARRRARATRGTREQREQRRALIRGPAPCRQRASRKASSTCAARDRDDAARGGRSRTSRGAGACRNFGRAGSSTSRTDG